MCELYDYFHIDYSKSLSLRVHPDNVLLPFWYISYYYFSVYTLRFTVSVTGKPLSPPARQQQIPTALRTSLSVCPTG